MSFDNWKKRCEIAKLPTVAERRKAIAALGINFSQPTEADEGYYRKPVTVKDPSGNGKNQIVDWIPVAYYIYDGALTGDIGKKPMTDDEIGDEQLWSWVVSNPIDYETYLAVIEGAPWPDMVKAEADGLEPSLAAAVLSAGAPPSMTHTNVAAGMVTATVNPPLDPIERVIGRTHNQPPADEAIPPHVQHATAIDNAIGAAPTRVASEAEAAVALGSKNRIAELRLAADKAGKAIYQPIHAAYVAERDKWLPMVNRAVKIEGDIQRAILTFRESERKRIAKEEAEAAARQREVDEANERSAQRAIAAGQPEAAPVVAPEPEPVIQQPAPIQPTYGKRKLKEEVKKFAVIEDHVEVYKFFASNAELQEILLRLATNAIRAGVTVPGCTSREGLI